MQMKLYLACLAGGSISTSMKNTNLYLSGFVKQWALLLPVYADGCVHDFDMECTSSVRNVI